MPRQCDASVYIHAGVPTGDWMKLARVAEIGNALALQLTVAHPSPKGRERKHQGETTRDRGLADLPSGTLRGLLYDNGNTDVDGGSTHGSGLNQDRSVQQANALLHARETEASSLQSGVEVESLA